MGNYVNPMLLVAASTLICVAPQPSVYGGPITITQATLPSPTNGRLIETTNAKRAEVAVVLTDKDGKIIDGSRSDTREIGTGPGLQNSTTFKIPEVFINPNTGESTEVIDVRQGLKI